MYAFIINMDSAVERWRHVEKAFSETGIPFERLPAINGRELTLPIPEFSERLYRRYHGKRPNLGQIGCYLSHIEGLKRFLASKHEYVIIAEDDITPSRNLKSLLHEAILRRESWDILRLSGFHHGHPLCFAKLKHGHSLAINFTQLCGSGAYMLHRQAAKVLLEKLKPMRVPIDHALDREWAYGLRAASIYPLPVDQQEHAFVSQIIPHLTEKLPAHLRYWTMGPYRVFNEFSRLVMRCLQWLSARFSHQRTVSHCATGPAKDAARMTSNPS